MFFILHADQLDQYPALMEQMFRLRARVFRDELQWVETEGDEERDVYDALNPVYVLHTDATGQHLYACGRLMPTSGPTLLADVFGETVPDAAAFQSPFVWEVTRLCVDDDLIREHGRSHERLAILRRMHIAALEFGVENGVEAYLANFDDLRLRMWRRFGAHFDVLGTSHAFSTTVHLGITECSEAVLEDARGRAGLSGPLLTDPPVITVPLIAPQAYALAA